MNYTIKKGRHYASPPTFGLYIDKRVISKKVTFDISSVYTLNSEDQQDINKLFGIGYFWSHHTDSARFGWRCINNNIELLAYCYVNGNRVIQPLLSGITMGQELECVIQLFENSYDFIIRNSEKLLAFYSIPKTHTKTIGFPLGFYFGGNQTAPHNITIKMI